MKSYFLRLFSYDIYANQLLLKSITDAGSPKKAIELMAHLLAAQQIWLNRCKGLPTIGGALWPDWPIESLTDIALQNNESWLAYLDGLALTDFENIVSYKNSKGDGFENKHVDVFAHLINHGTHHRAQIGQYLKAAGVESLPSTDYIFYIRAQNANM